MMEYTLSQQYALVGLDRQDCIHMPIAKRAVLRAVAAAKFLEETQEGGAGLEPAVFEEKLRTGLKRINRQSRKEARKLEEEIARPLIDGGVLEEAPDILGCDMNYYTAGVDMKTYRCDQEQYLAVTEGLRAEILEEGPVTWECVCLLWLFRESGCIHDIFSQEEQKTICSRMSDLSAMNESYRILWQSEFCSGLENFVGGFLRGKRNLFKNPYLEGVNVMFPFLDRRQSIFVDYVILGTDVKGRRLALLMFLTERGHYVEEVKSGSETLLKVDNVYYRVFPKTVSYGKIPIQGSVLLPVYR